MSAPGRPWSVVARTPEGMSLVAYVSLYRRYRPQSFAEVVGQDHVTRTIINALDEGRLHHAYLFTGPRGTGKTSTARILAKSVNCEQGPTSTPCNACSQCDAITTGSSVDVIELDMASHGGVDDARELRERALFAPASARKKVYILDEVHMASTAAFNALLKLIEEPPDHVIFAMATTDPQKVLPTIMSRVQRLDLRRVPAPAVAAHLQDIVAREGGTIDDLAVEVVVRAGDGSVRDTLSVLEQVLAFTGGHVTGDDVVQVLGHTPYERTAAAVDAAAAGDLAAALGMVQQLVDDGQDLRRFALDLVQHLRDLLVRQVAPDRPDLVDATDERREQLSDQAARVDRHLLLRAMDDLAAALTEMRQGPPRLPLELALARVTVASSPSSPPASTPEQPAPTTVAAAVTDEAVEVGEPATDDPPAEDDLAARARLRADETAARGGPPAVPDDRPPGPEADYPAPPPPDDTADLQAIVDRWAAILELVRESSPRFHAIYEPARPVKLRHGILTLAYAERYRSFHAEQARRGDHEQALADGIDRACGVRIRVDTVIDGDAPRPPRPGPVSPAGGSGARTDIGGGEAAPDAAEEENVREAEESVEPVDPGQALQHAAAVLTDELGATEVPADDA